MATAEVEWLVGVVRVWIRGSYGDPYQFAATVRRISVDEVELVGCVAVMDREIWVSLCDTFRAQGVRVIWFTKKNTGTDRRIPIDTSTCRRVVGA